MGISVFYQTIQGVDPLLGSLHSHGWLWLAFVTSAVPRAAPCLLGTPGMGRLGSTWSWGGSKAPSALRPRRAASATGRAPRPHLLCRAHLPHPPHFSETPTLGACRGPAGAPPAVGEFTPMGQTLANRDTKQQISTSCPGLKSQTSPRWPPPAHSCARTTQPRYNFPLLLTARPVLHPGSCRPLPRAHTLR